MAQTPDGFLWLATGDGLFRFDGLSFERISEASDDLGLVGAMTVRRDGSLWAWFVGAGRLAVYRNGRLEFLPSPEVEGQVTRMAEDHTGALWITQGQPGFPVYRYRDGEWTRIDAAAGMPRAGLTDLEVTADGAVWLAYTDYTLRMPRGGTRFEVVPGLDSSMARLSQAPDGTLWHLDRGRARQVTGPGGALLPRPSPTVYPADRARRPGEPVFDAEGNIWESNPGEGVSRVRTTRRTPGELDRFRAVDGLTGDVATAAFRDREGSIWVATTAGLDRFRRAAVVPEPRFGRTAAYGDILMTASDGTVYVGAYDAVYRVRPFERPELWQTGVGEPQGLCEASDRTIWLLTATEIRGVGADGRVSRLPRPPGALREVYDCIFDPQGGFQVAAGEDGTFRWYNGAWAQAPTRWGEQMAGRALVRDQDGALWATIAERGLARWTPEGWQEVLTDKALMMDGVRSVLPTAEGLIFAGRDGAAVLGKDGRVRGPIKAMFTNGLVRTPTGETWALNKHGLIRFRRDSFERALADSAHDPARRVFSSADGFTGIPANQLWRALVQGGDGRIWVSAEPAPFWIDPAHIPVNTIAPGVRITRIEGEKVSQRDPVSVKVPAGSSDLTVSFAALSLVSPDRVQVRYRLMGVDRQWVDPGARRQAFYTNLAPGRYRFQVIAANEDGVWNRQGATLSFAIAPTFLQSIWFKFLVGLCVIAAAWGVYMLRMRAVTAAIRARFQVRIAERERIARELHDTLLQGVQGLVLRFQSVANRLPTEGDLRVSVDETLNRADALIVEGRSRLRDLRRAGADIDLGRAIADAASEIAGGSGPELQVTIEGEARALEPSVAEELLRISEEALRNAIQHGGGDRIEVLLDYGRRNLRLAIRDNGAGMAPNVMENGSPDGHYGLIGMRERAERIGGRFGVISRPGEGTEVSTQVPGDRAYREEGVFSWRRLLRRLRPGGLDA